VLISVAGNFGPGEGTRTWSEAGACGRGM
jgi:hypothetical protein